ncbi:MAG: hypothetical protein CMF96_12900 [Candidatus Marinimicrobia bacterium]|nr:hypothetical protein [Candidatus Neomarinimicrobiota bacterium]|tara:strand:- start:2437 stop:2871 length:435 start_codon:yes stop_codon:yes gene_type:complete
MIINADLSSILFQIFIIWIISSIFSGKKNKDKKPSKINRLVTDSLKKMGKSIEEKIKISEIIPSDYKLVVDEIFNETENKLKEEEPEEIVYPIEIQKNKKSQDIIVKEVKRDNLKTKLGLKSTSKIRKAIILNEILSKPVSLRR